MKTEQEIWVAFASAALASSTFEINIPKICRAADLMLGEYDRRYGQTAILIAGIRDCHMCQKPIVGPHMVSDGKDGLYKKFCMECVEKAKSTAESYPGIDPNPYNYPPSNPTEALQDAIKTVGAPRFKCAVCGVDATHEHPDLGPVCETHRGANKVAKP